MSRDPYFFPFHTVNKNELISGDNYYMKLNNNIIRKFVEKKRNVPVSDLKGTFVRLHTEPDIDDSIEYAVFTNVYIMNKMYKQGLCNMMLVRFPDGVLAIDDCDSYSDNFKNRSVNEDREVYLAINVWRFGLPSEVNIVTKKVFEKITPKINESLAREVENYKGFLTGGKKFRKTKNKTKNSYSQKTTRKMKGGTDQDRLSEDLSRLEKEADELLEPYKKSHQAYYSGFGYTLFAIGGIAVGLSIAKLLKK